MSDEKNSNDIYNKTDVLSVSGELGIVNQIELQGRSFAGSSVSNYGVVNTGDIVYTKSPLKVNPYGIIKSNKGKTGIVSTLYAIYRPKNITNPFFVQTYFEQNARVNNYLHPLVNKGAKNDMKVSDSNALLGNVIFPKKTEQDKIYELFTNLGNLITLHQRKYNCFSNSWEQRKLEEISNRFDNLRVPVSANEREKGTTPYYGANGIQDYVKGFTHNGEYVLIAEDGANDLKNYPVKYVNGLFWANNHVHVVQGKEGICDNKYLKYCFTKTNIESLLVGGGRAKLNANIMMGIELTVPSFNEQVELGRMFYELDNLITLHQHKELKRRKDKNGHLRW